VDGKDDVHTCTVEPRYVVSLFWEPNPYEIANIRDSKRSEMSNYEIARCDCM
jgi:hypothetical protein